MNLLTQILHIASSGASAYILSSGIRDLKTRPDLLAGFQFAESNSVPFLEILRDRAEAEGDLWMAERLERHASDERRHGQIFAHGLKQLNKKAMELQKVNPQTGETQIDESKRSPFFSAYFADYPQTALKPQVMDWEVFLASSYILELDASQEFARLANALPDDDLNANLKKGVLSIAADEGRHSAYLYEAMERRFGTRQTQVLIDQWRTRKVKAMLALVSHFIQHGGQITQMAEEGVPIDMSAEPTPIAA
jgi:rubrerythrin